MLLLGLILVALGALAVLAAVFAVDVSGTVEFLGQDVGGLTLYLIGLGSGLAIMWGLSLMKWGTKRGWARRKEQKRLEELNEKLDRVDHDKHGIDEHTRDDRPTI